MLHEEIMRHKRIFAKLYFNGDAVFNEISLIVGSNGNVACFFDRAFLFGWC